jgi:hypothetical protein
MTWSRLATPIQYDVKAPPRDVLDGLVVRIPERQA